MSKNDVEELILPDNFDFEVLKNVVIYEINHRKGYWLTSFTTFS